MQAVSGLHYHNLKHFCSRKVSLGSYFLQWRLSRMHKRQCCWEKKLQ